MIGAIDDRVRRSRGRADAWDDVSSIARSQGVKWPFGCSVCLSAELCVSLEQIPFCDVGRVEVDDRLHEVLTRAASALERLRQEHCMKRGEDWPPEHRLGLRFAARVPTRSEGPRFRHLCLVIDPSGRGAPILRIGEADQLHDILRPYLRSWALRYGRPSSSARSAKVEHSGCSTFGCPPTSISLADSSALGLPPRSFPEAASTLSRMALRRMSLQASCVGDAGKGLDPSRRLVAGERGARAIERRWAIR